MTQNIRKGFIATLASLMLVGVVGCAEQKTSAENKAAAVNRWHTARAGIMYGVAEKQFESGDLEKAERTIAEVLAIDLDNAHFNVLAARIALEQSQLERAYRHLQIAQEAEPKYAEAHYYVGIVMQRWREFDRAFAAYTRAYEADPENPTYLIASSEMLVKMGMAEQALEKLNDKMIYFDYHSGLRVAAASIYMLDKRFDEAVEMYREAHLLSPDEVAILEQLALAEYANEQFASAIIRLEELIEMPEMDQRRDLWLALGDSYQLTGRMTDARLVFLEMTKRDASDVDAWIKLGQAAWIVKDNWRLGESARHVVALAPDRHEGHLLSGMAAHRANETERAVAAFNRAAELAPENATPYILKGLTLERAGDVDAAAASYQQALRVSPDDERAARLLSRVDGTL